MQVWNSQFLEQAQEILGERHKGRLGHRAFRMNDDVPSRGYLLPLTAHYFAQSPPDAVAHHRAAQCLLDAETETVQGKFVRTSKDGEVGTREALSRAVYAVEVTAVHQARLARKRQAQRGPGATTQV